MYKTVLIIFVVLLGYFIYAYADKMSHGPQLKVEGISFTLAKGWSIRTTEPMPTSDLRRSGTMALIAVPDPENTVELPVEVAQPKNEKELLAALSGISGETLSNGAVIKDGGCAPGTCYYIQYKDTLYSVGFGFAKINGVDVNPYEGKEGERLTWTKEEMVNFLHSLK